MDIVDRDQRLPTLAAALRAAWGPDTCAPEDVSDWSPENPARAREQFGAHEQVVGGTAVEPPTGSHRVEREHAVLRDRVRQAARRLVDHGEVEITQGGHVVDPSSAKGPIRIRLPS
jgi:hypothetical protein